MSRDWAIKTDQKDEKLVRHKTFCVAIWPDVTRSLWRSVHPDHRRVVEMNHNWNTKLHLLVIKLHNSAEHRTTTDIEFQLGRCLVCKLIRILGHLKSSSFCKTVGNDVDELLIVSETVWTAVANSVEQKKSPSDRLKFFQFTPLNLSE